jgi:sialate O-acetylesterase
MSRRLLVALFLLLPLSLFANVRLPRLYRDGMVVQRERPVPVYGWAEAGERVVVSFVGEKRECVAGADGAWRLTFPALAAGGPHEIVVRGANEIVVRNVLVGDVWLVSGQSNIDIPVARVAHRYSKEIASSRDDSLRMFSVPVEWGFDGPRADYNGGDWVSASPEALPGFSATSYFFAREYRARTGVPVGIVAMSLGGSRIESWLGAESLAPFPAVLAEAALFRDPAYVQAVEERNRALARDWHAALEASDAGLNAVTKWSDADFRPEGWAKVRIPGYLDVEGLSPNGSIWIWRQFDVPEAMAGREAVLNLGTIVDADRAYVNGVEVGYTSYQYPPRRYRVPQGVIRAGRNTIALRIVCESGRPCVTAGKPCEILLGEERLALSGEWLAAQGAAMPPKEPETFVRWKPTGLYNAMLAPLQVPLRGVVWYQGESNTGEPEAYTPYMKALMAQWRSQSGDPELPLVAIQLPNFMEPQPDPADGGWARFREVQRRFLELPRTALVVTIDLGEWNDIHPENKLDVGRRAALAALKLALGQEIVASGPRCTSMRVEGPAAILGFEDVGGGLVSMGCGGLKRFTLAGEDGVYHPAWAVIEGESVIVRSDEVPRPVSVRYAWADNPDGANLYNAEGLPASPFQMQVDEAE